MGQEVNSSNPSLSLSFTFSDLRLVSLTVANCDFHNCLPETKNQTLFPQNEHFHGVFPLICNENISHGTRLSISGTHELPSSLLNQGCLLHCQGPSQLTFVHPLASASWTSFLLTLPCLPTWYMPLQFQGTTQGSWCMWNHDLVLTVCSPDVSHYNTLSFMYVRLIVP